MIFYIQFLGGSDIYAGPDKRAVTVLFLGGDLIEEMMNRIRDE